MIPHSIITETVTIAPDITVEVLEFVPKHTVEKTIIKKMNGTFSFASVQEDNLPQRTAAFDTFAQVIDGPAEIIIGDKRYHLRQGEGIIIPSGVSYRFHASKRFKIIFTVITQDKHK